MSGLYISEKDFQELRTSLKNLQKFYYCQTAANEIDNIIEIVNKINSENNPNNPKKSKKIIRTDSPSS